jgi:hypothetical protein
MPRIDTLRDQHRRCPQRYDASDPAQTTVPNERHASIFTSRVNKQATNAPYFQKHIHPCRAWSSMWSLHNIGSPIRCFPAHQFSRILADTTLRWVCRPFWGIAMMLIGWLLHVNTANSSSSCKSIEAHAALGTCSPRELTITLRPGNACSPCFSGTPPLVPLMSGGLRARPGGPPAR